MTDERSFTNHERRIGNLESGKPDVIAERVANMAEDIRELRGEIASLRRYLIGFFISLSLLLIGYAATNAFGP